MCRFGRSARCKAGKPTDKINSFLLISTRLHINFLIGSVFSVIVFQHVYSDFLPFRREGSMKNYTRVQ